MLVRRVVVQMEGSITHYTSHTAHGRVASVCRVLGGGKYKPALLNPLISTWLLVLANAVSSNHRAPGTCFQIRGIVPGTKKNSWKSRLLRNTSNNVSFYV